MKKTKVAFIALFLMAITGCSTINDHDPEKQHNALANTVCELEPVVSIDIGGDEETACRNERMTIQDFFEPKYIIAFPPNIINTFFFSEELDETEEMPDFIKFYPFGEIVEQGAEGKASFVIFIGEGYQVEQQVNLLRITPVEDTQPNRVPVFMEITQVPNITVEEMEYKTLAAIDFTRYPINHHSQPWERFPFVAVQLQDGRGGDSTVTSTYIRDNYHGGVFVITTQYLSRGSTIYSPDFRNALKTLEIITEPEFLSLDNDNNAEDLCTGSIITIQSLFDPKFVMVFMEGMPELVRYYPFGEIVEAEGMSSFVIFIEDFYQVEQRDNLLRVINPWNDPPYFTEIFMEIKQVPNTTIEEMEYKIEASFDFGFFSSLRGQSPENFSIITLEFYDDLDFVGDDVIIHIYIRDNGNGGVFVVTMQYCIVGFTGAGVRFLNSIWTMEIIETGR